MGNLLVSPHTIIMNAIIGFVKSSGIEWPNIFKKYEKILIEYTIPFTDEETRISITPDIIINYRGKSHVLIFECKSNLLNVNDRQLDKYMKFITKDCEDKILWSRGLIQFVHPHEYKSELIYAGFGNNCNIELDLHSSLKNRNIPSLIFCFDGDNPLNIRKIILANKHFLSRLDDSIKNIFPLEIDKSQKVPLNLYPFSPKDLDDRGFDIIKMQFLTSLINLTLKAMNRSNNISIDADPTDGIEISVTEIINDMLPYKEFLSPREKRVLRSKIISTLNDGINSNDSLKKYIVIASGKIKIKKININNPRSVDTFIKNIRSVMEAKPIEALEKYIDIF